MVFYWSLSDSKSPQVSRILLSIPAVLNNAVIWMVSTRPPTSKSSSPFSNPLFTVLNAPITISVIVTCMFHSFFNSLARSRYLSLFSHSFSFIRWSAGTAKSTILPVIFVFLLIIIKSGLLVGIRWSVCMLKSHSPRVFNTSFNWWFFTGSDCQKDSPGLHYSSKYSSWSQQCCGQDGFFASSTFQFLQSLFQAFGDRPKRTIYNWDQYYSRVPLLLQLSSKIQVFVSLLVFFHFFFAIIRKNTQIPHLSSNFLLIKTKSCNLNGIRWSIFI